MPLVSFSPASFQEWVFTPKPKTGEKRMESVDVTLKVPKESKEVIDLLKGVVEKVKAGAEVNDYLTLIGDLSSALDGVDQIPAEAKSEGRDEIIAYLINQLMPIF
jgi:hypothetical protein